MFDTSRSELSWKLDHQLGNDKKDKQQQQTRAIFDTLVSSQVKQFSSLLALFCLVHSETSATFIVSNFLAWWISSAFQLAGKIWYDGGLLLILFSVYLSKNCASFKSPRSFMSSQNSLPPTIRLKTVNTSQILSPLFLLALLLYSSSSFVCLNADSWSLGELFCLRYSFSIRL